MKLFDDIKLGLEQAVEHEQGKPGAAVTTLTIEQPDALISPESNTAQKHDDKPAK